MMTPMALGLVVAPLFVPADRPERFAKAAASGADAIVVDLEDGVAPAAKDFARENLSRAAALECFVIVRVNGRSTPWHEADLQAVGRLPGAALMLPKAETVGDAGSAVALMANGAPVVALIESTRGLAEARAIASVCARLAFGSLDYCVDLGCLHTDQALIAARSELVLAARLAEIPPPIDGVTLNIGDVQALRSDTARSRELGFGGKLCIHPQQVGAVIEGFAPTEVEIREATRILAGPSEGAARIGNAMVDAPVRRMAEQVLARQNKANRHDSVP